MLCGGGDLLLRLPCDREGMIMTTVHFYRTLLLPLVIALSSCGGGGGGGGGGGLAAVSTGGGIGGTGVTSSGTVDGFGSIFVNGVEYETDEAQILIDGESVD